MLKFDRILRTIIAAIGLASTVPSAAAPNVLFVFSDDQRADTIAALGNAHIKTPHLDQLVKTGTAFTRAYCMGAMQGAVCVPSRAMLMTGKSLTAVEEKMKSESTWPEYFGKSGYTTFASGKWHNSAESLQRSFQRTAAIFMGGMGNPYEMRTTDEKLTAAGAATEPNNTAPKAKREGKTGKSAKKEGDPKAHSVERFTDAGVRFIQSRKGEPAPWLCYVAYNLPHDPKTAPPDYHLPYQKNPPPLPANYLVRHPFDNGELNIRDEKLINGDRTEKAVREHLADYYACVTYVDAQFGRLIQALVETDQFENTIIVFASDHGLAIGSHGLMGKQNLYEHSMKAPLIMAGPGIPKGEQRDALCYLFDIYPTLGDLTKVPGPAGSEGISLVPVLANPKVAHRKHIATGYRNLQRAVTDGHWKYIRYTVKEAITEQLFDLSQDPAELKDLSKESVHSAELERLRKLILN
jgi:arylsulfatase A-like enzyme